MNVNSFSEKLKQMIKTDRNGNKYVLDKDLSDLNTAEYEMASCYLIAKNIEIKKEITKKDRSEFVRDFEYGTITDCRQTNNDVPVYSEVHLEENDELTTNFDGLIELLNKTFLPNKYGVYPKEVSKKTNLKDLYAAEGEDFYYSVQLNKLLKLRLSEVELSFAINYLEENGIMVCGISHELEDDFSNYNLWYRDKYIKLPKALTSEENDILFKKLEKENITDAEKTKIRKEIIEGNMRFAMWVLNDYNRKNVGIITRDDYETYAYEGLIKAVDTFKVELGFKFTTYAYHVIFHKLRTINCEILGLEQNIFSIFLDIKKLVEIEYGRKYTIYDREMINDITSRMVRYGFINEKKAKDLIKKMNEKSGLIDVIEYVSEIDAEREESLEIADSVIASRIILETLTEEEKFILLSRYCRHDGRLGTFGEVAQKLGKTGERVRQIETKICNSIKARYSYEFNNLKERKCFKKKVNI